MSKLVYDYSIISVNNGSEDQSGARGRFVQTSGALVTAATGQVPLGVLTDGGVANARSAVCVSGSGHIAKVRLSATPGTVNVGTFLTLTANGTVAADAGTGARVQVARALESGAANELIDAVILPTAVLS